MFFDTQQTNNTNKIRIHTQQTNNTNKIRIMFLDTQQQTTQTR